MVGPARKVKVAVTQAEPVYLDLDGTVKKTIKLIQEAAGNGAKLIAFPEVWIPGYPAWIWNRPLDPELTSIYMKNSLAIDSPEMTSICEAAKDNDIIVALGFSENDNNSLYIAQAIIGADGKIMMKRRKIKPTHMERTVYGDGSGGSLLNVAETPVGKVGALSCWEHIQPLLKYHTICLREEIHIAAWPPLYPHHPAGLFSMSQEGIESLSSVYAMESQTFVLHSSAVLSEKSINAMKCSNNPPGVMNVPGGGVSAVYGPDGRKLTQNLPPTEEGILYAELDFEYILQAKSFLDIAGHYSRPDLLRLVADTTERQCVGKPTSGSTQ